MRSSKSASRPARQYEEEKTPARSNDRFYLSSAYGQYSRFGRADPPSPQKGNLTSDNRPINDSESRYQALRTYQNASQVYDASRYVPPRYIPPQPVRDPYVPYVPRYFPPVHPYDIYDYYRHYDRQRDLQSASQQDDGKKDGQNDDGWKPHEMDTTSDFINRYWTKTGMYKKGAGVSIKVAHWNMLA